MVGRSWAFRYQALFDLLVVVASYAAGVINKVIYGLSLLAILLVFSVVLSFKQYRESAIQSESKELKKVLEQNILPQVKRDYYQIHPERPEVRFNIMIYRRRNINPLTKNRGDVRFWKKTLKIEAALGDYVSTSEDELEWKADEGVVGRAMNKRAQEIWASIEYDDKGRVLAGWNLTEAQAQRTEHIQSLLCVPIYLQSDDEKIEPVGVLNVDSTEPLSNTQFGREEIRENIIQHANIVGAIIE